MKQIRVELEKYRAFTSSLISALETLHVHLEILHHGQDSIRCVKLQRRSLKSKNIQLGGLTLKRIRSELMESQKARAAVLGQGDAVSLLGEGTEVKTLVRVEPYKKPGARSRGRGVGQDQGRAGGLPLSA